jgi:CHASE2 domain-containing sensor protein
VLDGEREALRELEGRIVFIGASEVENRARAGRDTFRMVLSGSIRHSGVEIAATACLNLLHGDAALTPAWPAMALFAGGAAAVIAAFAALPPLAALASLPLAGAVATGLAHLALEMLRLALPIASALMVSLPLGLLGGILPRYAALRRAARRQPARALGLP